MIGNARYSYNYGKLKTPRGVKEVIYLVGEKPMDTISVKDKLMQFGAKFNSRPTCWYWEVGNNANEVIEKKVRPCLAFLQKTDNVQDIIDKLIAKINNARIPNVPGADSAEDIKAKLEKFKQDLISITSDEEFKAKMEPIIKFRNANNYQYSFGNIILILIQDPEATLVKPGGHWKKYFNRTPIEGAKPILLWMPTEKRNYSNEEKETLTIKFLNKKKVDSVDKLSPADKETLDRRLNKGIALKFDLMPYWYDYRFTEQMPNTEDVLGDPNHDIQWYDDSGEETPELAKHIDALLEVIKGMGIQLSFVDDLGGARGVSKSGYIDILKEQPKNVGMFNTITHEFAHEILHQQYLKSNDDEMKNYFVGKDEGRQKVEQQAELCAWIVLRCFGYDMPTNINYVGIWGLNQDNAVKVFDSVSSTANLIVKKILQKENGEEDMFESKKYLIENGVVNVPTGEEIANMVGCGKVYNRAKAKQNNIIRMTESDLHKIIKETVNKIIKENFEISLTNNGKEGFNNVNRWRAAAHEIQTKGSTIINIPLDYNNFLQANLMKTQRGGIYLSTKGLNKEYVSISDAFKALQDHAINIMNN